MGKLLQKAIGSITKPQNTDVVIFSDGDTEDIISVILQADKEAAAGRFIKDFAPLLRGANDYDTCKNIWNFLKYEIPYTADKSGYERVKLPHKVIFDASNGIGSDCKGMAGTGCDLCRELGISAKYRFIAQKMFSTKPTHVYTVATLKNGEEIIIDAVFTAFNKEAKHTYEKDYACLKSKKTASIGSILRGYVSKNWI